jgi:predicted acetylornithine/succinylornithine family transaminase
MSAETSADRSSIVELFDRFVVPTYRRSLVLTHGAGSYVWDSEGKRYLDFGGGIAVSSLGHAHPRMVKVISEQAAKLIHTSNLYYHEPQGRLAEKLVGLTGPGKVFFCNSGAEANEAMFKLARKFGSTTGDRFEIITATNSFHGRTLAGISATGQEKVKIGFGPLVPGFLYAPFNDLDAFERAITDRTVAIMIEGIQGEGGIVPASYEFLTGLRKLTRERNLLFLLDAVQCGMFRTGCFQSYERIVEERGCLIEEVRPDGISMAKSLGGGFPLGAAWISAPFADVLQPGSHGTTYGGTPLACAVALEVLQTIEDENLSGNVRKIGQRLFQGLTALKEQGLPIKAVRGYGALIGFSVDGDLPTRVANLAEGGLLSVPAGTDTIRLLPALNASLAEADEALSIVEKHL